MGAKALKRGALASGAWPPVWDAVAMVSEQAESTPPLLTFMHTLNHPAVPFTTAKAPVFLPDVLVSSPIGLPAYVVVASS